MLWCWVTLVVMESVWKWVWCFYIPCWRVFWGFPILKRPRFTHRHAHSPTLDCFLGGQTVVSKPSHQVKGRKKAILPSCGLLWGKKSTESIQNPSKPPLKRSFFTSLSQIQGTATDANKPAPVCASTPSGTSSVWLNQLEGSFASSTATKGNVSKGWCFPPARMPAELFWGNFPPRELGRSTTSKQRGADGPMRPSHYCTSCISAWQS